MSLSFLPEMPKIDPEKGPNLMAGAASPLWLVFGGAAVAGATWWWWSARWREAAVNVEALMAPALTPGLAEVPLTPEPAVLSAPEPVIDPVTEAPILTSVALETPEPVAAAADGAAETVQETLDTVEALATEARETVEAIGEPVVQAAVEQAEALGDDLTLLVGVGPKLAASLAELGVTRFSEIAAWGEAELAEFDAKLNLKGRAERDAWVAQAKRLAAVS